MQIHFYIAKLYHYKKLKFLEVNERIKRDSNTKYDLKNLFNYYLNIIVELLLNIILIIKEL